MNLIRSKQLTAFAGFLTIALVIGNVVTYGNLDPTHGAATFTQYFTTHHSQVVVSIDLQFASIITFLIFIAGLYTSVKGASEDDHSLARMMLLGSGFVMAGLVAAWQAVYGAAALLSAAGGSAEVVRALVALAQTFDMTVTLPVVGLAGSAAWIALRSSALPHWTGWLGVIVAIAAAISVLNIPSTSTTGIGTLNPIAMVLWMIWMIGIGISFLRRPSNVSEASSVPANQVAPQP